MRQTQIFGFSPRGECCSKLTLTSPRAKTDGLSFMASWLQAGIAPSPWQINLDCSYRDFIRVLRAALEKGYRAFLYSDAMPQWPGQEGRRKIAPSPRISAHVPHDSTAPPDL